MVRAATRYYPDVELVLPVVVVGPVPALNTEVGLHPWDLGSALGSLGFACLRMLPLITHNRSHRPSTRKIGLERGCAGCVRGWSL